jgi:dephospho-CoA kinase
MSPSERSHQARATTSAFQGAAPVIGLTGGVASGKTAVADLLAERGFAVIDADSVGHQVLLEPAVQRKLVERFGPGVLAGEGLAAAGGPRIDRKALGAIVFADPDARRALEAIVHPLMRARFLEAIERERGAARPVVLDAAILLEAGWDDLCDFVVFVESPLSERMRRAGADRGWAAETFNSREAAQWPCEEKRRRAGFVIENSAGLLSLPREVDRLVASLLGPDGASFQKLRRKSPLAAPEAPGERPEDASGSDAWHDSCTVL